MNLILQEIKDVKERKILRDMWNKHLFRPHFIDTPLLSLIDVQEYKIMLDLLKIGWLSPIILKTILQTTDGELRI
mgnify:CR=1 FL=1